MTVEAGPRMAAGARGAGPVAYWIGAALGTAAVLAVNTTATIAGEAGRHWWANFILLPTAGIAAVGGSMMTGRGVRAAAGYTLFCFATIGFAVGAILMFGAMGRCWPLMIVLPAAALLGTVRWWPAEPAGRAVHGAFAGVAAVTLALGAAFQLRVGGGEPVERAGYHWWGWFIALAGVVMAGNAIWLRTDRSGYRISSATLLIGLGLAAVAVGLRAVYRW
ncbi:hypothetical protein [Rhizomonospora bruguierae]|uniref:hypothetical protein n=1 Tax=Rhizomonospora bruguierae TaxID=1581705 RepID=UPI001BCF9AD4|nr:hypothetical protein [Micromonospora sp. NBRC 107566]